MSFETEKGYKEYILLPIFLPTHVGADANDVEHNVRIEATYNDRAVEQPLHYHIPGSTIDKDSQILCQTKEKPVNIHTTRSSSDRALPTCGRDLMQRSSSERSRRSGQFGSFRLASSEGRRSTDEDTDTAIVKMLNDMPIHIRGRAQAWEIPRSHLQIMSKIGAGACSVVYKCKWRGVDCAAKLLSEIHNKGSGGSLAHQEMMNEICIISRLRHPNLVTFLGACTADNELMVLSELMAGGSLEARFEAMNNGSVSRSIQGSFQGSFRASSLVWKPPVDTAVHWITDLSKAVCYLHSCSIIHRDLKPANLLLTAEGRLKVSDFGLCKTLRKVREDGTPYQMTGNTGTKRYMAPEVVACNPQYDEKVDIYSMAMIFWYIFSGVRPFEGVSPDLVAELTSVRGTRPPVAAMGWQGIEALVERMWAQGAADRPSAAEIVDQLGGMQHPSKAVSARRRTSCACSLQ